MLITVRSGRNIEKFSAHNKFVKTEGKIVIYSGFRGILSGILRVMVRFG